jgi:effector-binding domain-containing protein
MATLARTQQAAASLRNLLNPPANATPLVIEHRRVPATAAAAVSEVIDVKDANLWYQGALGELHALLTAQKIMPGGPRGGIYADDLFSYERGRATIFLPCDQPVPHRGRVAAMIVPEAELAVATHVGSHDNVDLTYGALAAYVTDHALGVEGPIREFYLVGPHETADEDQWRTEIGWPIFRTGHARGPGKGSPV